MPDMMKFFVMHGIGQVGLMDKPVPHAGPNDASVRTTAALTCRVTFPNGRRSTRFSGGGARQAFGRKSTKPFVGDFARQSARSRLPAWRSSTASRYTPRKEEKYEATMRGKKSPVANDISQSTPSD